MANAEFRRQGPALRGHLAAVCQEDSRPNHPPTDLPVPAVCLRSPDSENRVMNGNCLSDCQEERWPRQLHRASSRLVALGNHYILPARLGFDQLGEMARAVSDRKLHCQIVVGGTGRCSIRRSRIQPCRQHLAATAGLLPSQCSTDGAHPLPTDGSAGNVA